MKLNQSLVFALGICAFVSTSVSAEFIACPIEKELGCALNGSGIQCNPANASFMAAGTNFPVPYFSAKPKKAVVDGTYRQCEYDCGSDCHLDVGFAGSSKSEPEKCTPVNDGSKIGFECP